MIADLNAAATERQPLLLPSVVSKLVEKGHKLTFIQGEKHPL